MARALDASADPHAQRGGLIERLCGDKPSLASKWLKVSVFKDVLALAKEDMTVDTWDADGELMGLPNGEIWDLVAGWAEPNFRRYTVTKQTGVDPVEYQAKTCRRYCGCAWHEFLEDVTGQDEDMAEACKSASEPHCSQAIVTIG